MDTFLADPAENLDFQAALQAENAQLEADDLNEQLIAQQAGLQPPPIVLFKVEDGLEKWNNRRRKAHRDQFPLSDHLFILMTIVQADLTEQRRERLTAHLTLRRTALRNHTFDLVRSSFLELFCAPRSSLETPSFRPTNQQNTFYAQDYGDLDAVQETGQLKKRRDMKASCKDQETFCWAHYEGSDAWVVRRFKGGRRLVKGSRTSKDKFARSRKNHVCVPALRFSEKEKKNEKQAQETIREDNITLPCGLVNRKRTIQNQVQCQPRNERVLLYRKRGKPS